MDYRLLIADDEAVIREGFIARLAWLGICPAEIYEADDGRTALEIIKEFRPEIVVTDIRMPDMDGLQLIASAREQELDAEFVILSGHAEFAYAEKAIQMGVNAYLLKPISNTELQSVMAEVEKKLKRKKELKNVVLEKVRMQKISRDMDMEKRLNEIFHNQDRAVREEHMGEGLKYLTAIINIDGNTYERAQFHYRDVDLIKFSIKNVFNELEINGRKMIVSNLANLNQLIAVIAGVNEKHIKQEAEYFFSKLVNTLESRMSVSLTIGSSCVHDRISRKGYEEAGEAFLQRMVSGTGMVYFHEDLKTLSDQKLPRAEIKLLDRYIERGDIRNIEILLNDIFSRERIQQYTTDYIRIIWVRIMNSMLKASDQNFKQEQSYPDKSVLNFEVIDHFNDIEELIQYICTLIIDFIRPQMIYDMKPHNKIMLAVQYLEKNYHHDMSVNELAYQHAMSPNYFSTSFKKETGMTIVNYIKKLRLDAACRLLEETEQSVVEISEHIGYSDSQYFFRVFKKEKGYTPMQYRKSRRS